jgi:LmbE family N-acetylglucosaminyl deacetylase
MHNEPVGTDSLEPMPEDWQRALAIVAHPDDLEYGASAAVATWTEAGHEVAYLLVTQGEAGIDGVTPAEAGPLRRIEQIAAAAAVGVHDVDFLDYSDGVIEHTTGLRQDLAQAIRENRPGLVLTLNHHDYWPGGGWNTADHRAVGRAVLDAVADAGNRWIFPELLQRGFEPWNGVRWIAVAGSPLATHAADVSATLERAVRSLSAHRTYLAALSDIEPWQQAHSFVEQLTNSVAQRFGGRPAVAFELLRR